MQPFSRQELKELLDARAREGIFLGTSSWKYEGWVGLIYSRERYLTRGKFSQAKFESTCLAEYAETFPTVCLDGGFYQFPTEKMLAGLFGQVGKDFQLSLKVTEDITTKHFSNLPRYGKRAGQQNIHFLDAELFIDRFLGPLTPHQGQVGTLFFEFGHFHAGDWERGRDFVSCLDTFLEKLPRGWNYSVEVRNANFLKPDYFSILRQHHVAHAFNSWSRMPSVNDQLAMTESETADFASARFLLKPGRTYEKAVQTFQPYSEIKEIYPEARQAIAQLAAPPVVQGRGRKRFIYVNNRLEGSSPKTILAALSNAG